MNYLLKISLSLAALAIGFSCSQKKTEQTTTTQTHKPSSADTIQLKEAPSDAVLKQYLALKDALVKSNAKESQQAASVLVDLLKANNQFASHVPSADSIAKTADLVQQRSTFTNLSNQLIARFEKEALLKGSFYVQFCPMANDGNGGYWLAAEQEVNNPYYGDEMLHCGEVKKTIK